MHDHVHLLVRVHPSIAVARLVGEAKGFSSYLVTHQLAPGQFFRWQEGYYAMAVPGADLAAVAHYVNTQPEHHGKIQELEPPDDR
jgi:REP element-mobilizing transposase RayT